MVLKKQQQQQQPASLSSPQVYGSQLSPTFPSMLWRRKKKNKPHNMRQEFLKKNLKLLSNY